MPVCRLLIRVSYPAYRRLVKVTSADHQPNRQTIAVIAAREY